MSLLNLAQRSFELWCNGHMDQLASSYTALLSHTTTSAALCLRQEGSYDNYLADELNSAEPLLFH